MDAEGRAGTGNKTELLKALGAPSPLAWPQSVHRGNKTSRCLHRARHPPKNKGLPLKANKPSPRAMAQFAHMGTHQLLQAGRQAGGYPSRHVSGGALTGTEVVEAHKGAQGGSVLTGMRGGSARGTCGIGDAAARHRLQ